jgi:hypothetical protein
MAIIKSHRHRDECPHLTTNSVGIAAAVIVVILMTTGWRRMRAAIYAGRQGTLATTTLYMVMKRKMIDIIEAVVVGAIVPLAPPRGIMTIRIHSFRGFHLWETL